MKTVKEAPVWQPTSLDQVYRHRNGRYYVRTYARGKEKWASLKTTLLSVAKHRAKPHLAAADKLRAAAVQTAATGTLNFGQALAIYRKQLGQSPLRPNTKAFREAGVKLVERSWENIATVNVQRITVESVVEWLRTLVAAAKPYVPTRAKRASRNSTGASQTTLTCALGTLRQILDAAVESGHLAVNPARQPVVARELAGILKKVRRDKAERGDLPVIPSKEDFTRLVQIVRGAGVSDCRAAANFIEFVAYCGARKNEAINVQWRDIDFAQGLVHLRVTKNGEARAVPMTAEMRCLLERLSSERQGSEESDLVLGIKDVQGFITSACRKLGIQRFTTHSLRHLFGTACLEAGVDVRTAAKWLGHKDNGALLLKTYSHVRPQHELEMVGKIRFGAPAEPPNPDSAPAPPNAAQ
jgi:integrase